MLKMDPKQRITAEEALNHPYFQRAGTLSEVEIKKNKECLEEKKDDSNDFHPNHSNNLLALQKSPLPLNNFVD
jgi:serine/threonine protein kinase